jgi:heme A synthase
MVMNSKRQVVLFLSLLVLAEYVLGGFVTFDDPTNAGFSLTSFSTSYPAVLPLIHRLFAVLLILAWIIGSFYLRGTAAFRPSHLTIALMFVQAIIGALIPATLSDGVLNAYVIIAHFSVSGLVIIGTGFTLYLGWFLKGPPLSSKVHKPQETR